MRRLLCSMALVSLIPTPNPGLAAPMTQLPGSVRGPLTVATAIAPVAESGQRRLSEAETEVPASLLTAPPGFLEALRDPSFPGERAPDSLAGRLRWQAFTRKFPEVADWARAHPGAAALAARDPERVRWTLANRGWSTFTSGHPEIAAWSASHPEAAAAGARYLAEHPRRQEWADVASGRAPVTAPPGAEVMPDALPAAVEVATLPAMTPAAEPPEHEPRPEALVPSIPGAGAPRVASEPPPDAPTTSVPTVAPAPGTPETFPQAIAQAPAPAPVAEPKAPAAPAQGQVQVQTPTPDPGTQMVQVPAAPTTIHIQIVNQSPGYGGATGTTRVELQSPGGETSPTSPTRLEVTPTSRAASPVLPQEDPGLHRVASLVPHLPPPPQGALGERAHGAPRLVAAPGSVPPGYTFLGTTAQGVVVSRPLVLPRYSPVSAAPSPWSAAFPRAPGSSWPGGRLY